MRMRVNCNNYRGERRLDAHDLIQLCRNAWPGALARRLERSARLRRTDMGDPLSPRSGRTVERQSALRPRHRQQVTRLRFGEDQDRRCGCWLRHSQSCDHYRTEDQSTGAVRTHRRRASERACSPGSSDGTLQRAIISSRRRRASVTSSPPYLDFHLLKVGGLIPWRRQTSAVGIPASRSCNTALICSSRSLLSFRSSGSFSKA